jgi:uncharacterized protein (TIGR01777 family)
MSIRIAVTGASGFLGQAICRKWLSDGVEVLGISRTPEKMETRGLKGMRWSTLETADLSGFTAVVHLAGERILPGRWTAARKARIRSSRVEGTQKLVEAMKKASPSPLALIASSGVAYYGDRVDHEVTESSPLGEGFLAEVCRDWESASMTAEAQGTRVVCMRLGIVLDAHGGALKSMLPAFRMGAGGPMGSGTQPFPWIHLQDVVSFIHAAISRDDVSGPFNLVAGALAQREFAKKLGKSIRRPSFLPAPSFALRLLMGEGADALLGGQNVRSERLEQVGLSPKFEHLDDALAEIFGKD